MLKIIEFGLLAVSLLTIFGLVLRSPRNQPTAPAEEVAEEPVTGHAPLGAKKS